MEHGVAGATSASANSDRAAAFPVRTVAVANPTGLRDRSLVTTQSGSVGIGFIGTA
jgi:hypothetical protein